MQIKTVKLSVRIAKGIAEILESEAGERLAGQTSGSEFEAINAEFIRDTFLVLNHIRPGHWEIRKIGNRNRMVIAGFEQYAHLAALDEASKNNPELAAALGNYYTITPDIIIVQNLLQDAELNRDEPMVDLNVSRRAAIRAINGGNPLLHASISSRIRSE
jgi:hypothetical protein